MDTKGWWKYELVLPGLVLALVLVLLCAVAASAKAVEPYPIREDACGAWGNLYAIGQAMRNQEVDIHEALFDLLYAAKQCEDKWGDKADSNCAVHGEYAKKWAMDQFKVIWANVPKDPMDSGFDTYTQCLQANKGKST